MFDSIQGEGPLIGIPMMFVRTNRCNLRCKWCDSAYTFQGGNEYMLEHVLAEVSKSKMDWICFTGGEPLLQRDALEFVKGAVKLGKKVLIETSGSLPIDEYVKIENTVIDMDIKTPSSQEEDSLEEKNLSLLRDSDYAKFVIADQRDFDYSVDFLKKLGNNIQVVFQPAWGSSLKDLTERVLKLNLKVRVLPQLHKLIWGEIPGV